LIDASAHLRWTHGHKPSFIRTVTVGPGISPDLLTLPWQALAGYSQAAEKVSWS